MPTIANNPEKKTVYIDENQNKVAIKLQERVRRKKEVANFRLKLYPQFAAICTSREYTETLAEIQTRTREAKNNDEFDPSNYYCEIWTQATQHIQNNQHAQAQALIDFLFTSNHTYPEVQGLNRTQRSNNMALKWGPADIKSEANREVLTQV